MKELMTNLAVFVVFCIAISGMTACSGTSTTTNGVAPDNSAATPPGTNTSSSNTKASEYPQLAATIRGADVSDLDGNTFKFDDYRGKVLLVNLWALYCVPCRQEMPELAKMQDEFRDRGLEIFGLTIASENEESTERTRAFATKLNITYKIGRSDPRLTSELMRISRFDAIPQSFLIDRDGRLRGVFTGGGSVMVKKIHDNIERIVGESASGAS